MKVTFVTYPTAFAIAGGGEMQFLKTHDALRELGVNAQTFDHYGDSYLDTDILHIFSVFSSMEFFASWAIDNHVPYVVSPILWPKKYDARETDRLWHILGNAKSVLTNSRAESEQIRKVLGINPPFVEIINGIDTKKFENVERKRHKIRDDTVLSICNVDTRKNLERLALACVRLDKKLRIAGRIRDQALWQNLITAFPETIEYAGYVENGSQRHIDLMSTSAIYANLGLFETPGISALEAGAVGMPLVSTNMGATKEYFGRHALYADPESVDSITDALAVAFKQPAITQDVARQHFLSFSWDRAALQTLDVYQNVMSSRTNVLS